MPLKNLLASVMFLNNCAKTFFPDRYGLDSIAHCFGDDLQNSGKPWSTIAHCFQDHAYDTLVNISSIYQILTCVVAPIILSVLVQKGLNKID